MTPIPTVFRNVVYEMTRFPHGTEEHESGVVAEVGAGANPHCPDDFPVTLRVVDSEDYTVIVEMSWSQAELLADRLREAATQARGWAADATELRSSLPDPERAEEPPLPG